MMATTLPVIIVSPSPDATITDPNVTSEVRDERPANARYCFSSLRLRSRVDAGDRC